MSVTKSFLIEWNYKFPIDRWWRQKYSIPLFSPQHLEMSQIDIMMEYVEDKLFQELFLQRDEEAEFKKQFEEHGIVQKKQILSEEREEELFSKMKISDIK